MATRQVSIYEDKETGDINELRDNKLAKLGISDPNANVGATDYVELMTSTGEPIKVTQQSLAAALGSIFAASDPKTFTKLLGMNSGSPMGIGPSDLASVLGASLGDVGNIANPPLLSSFGAGIFITSDSSYVSGLPSDFGTSCVMFIRANNINGYSTIAICVEANKGIYAKYLDTKSWFKITA